MQNNRKNMAEKTWRKRFIFFAFAFSLCLISEKTALAQLVSPVKEDSKKKVFIEGKSSVIPIREEVKILRAQRRQKMPYLDKSYIDEVINPDAIRTKQEFVEKRQKNLIEVIGRAVEVYTPAKAAKERIVLGKRRILVAARELLPGGSFNFDIRRGQLSADAFKGDDYHLSFRVPVFRGGILWNTLLKERAEYRAAKKEYDAVINELVEEVSSAYFEYNRALQGRQDKRELAQKARKQQLISKKKYERALISEIESLNVESMAGQMQYEVETAEQELELAKLELQRYLDLDITEEIQIKPFYNIDELISKAKPAEPLVPGEEKEKKLLKGKNLDDFVELAYANRPELQVEGERLRASRLEEKISRGVFLPRADLTMEFGELGEAFIRNSTNSPHQPEWRLLFEVSNNFFGNKAKFTYDNDENAPSVTQFQQGTGSQSTHRKMELGFFDGLEDYAELKEAQVKKLEQVIELEKKEQEVIREVKEAYFDYHKAEVQVASSIKRNQYRQKLVSLAKLRLEKAEIEISEYLQAELELSEERERLHQGLADYFKAKSKLNRAIGVRDFLPIEESYAL